MDTERAAWLPIGFFLFLWVRASSLLWRLSSMGRAMATFAVAVFIGFSGCCLGSGEHRAGLDLFHMSVYKLDAIRATNTSLGIARVSPLAPTGQRAKEKKVGATGRLENEHLRDTFSGAYKAVVNASIDPLLFPNDVSENMWPEDSALCVPAESMRERTAREFCARARESMRALAIPSVEKEKKKKKSPPKKRSAPARPTAPLPRAEESASPTRDHIQATR